MVVKVGDRVLVTEGEWAGCTGIVYAVSCRGFGELAGVGVRLDNVYIGGKQYGLWCNGNQVKEVLPEKVAPVAKAISPSPGYRILEDHEVTKATDQRSYLDTWCQPVSWKELPNPKMIGKRVGDVRQEKPWSNIVIQRRIEWPRFIIHNSRKRAWFIRLDPDGSARNISLFDNKISYRYIEWHETNQQRLASGVWIEVPEAEAMKFGGDTPVAWLPPDPGNGYRLLEVGETDDTSDEYWDSVNREWSRVGMGAIVITKDHVLDPADIRSYWVRRKINRADVSSVTVGDAYDKVADNDKVQKGDQVFSWLSDDSGVWIEAGSSVGFTPLENADLYERPTLWRRLKGTRYYIPDGVRAKSFAYAVRTGNHVVVYEHDGKERVQPLMNWTYTNDEAVSQGVWIEVSEAVAKARVKTSVLPLTECVPVDLWVTHRVDSEGGDWPIRCSKQGEIVPNWFKIQWNQKFGFFVEVPREGR